MMEETRLCVCAWGYECAFEVIKMNGGVHTKPTQYKLGDVKFSKE